MTLRDGEGDAALLQAWREGDADAGRKLVRLHTPTLHRFFASKAPEAVEDLVQAVFIAAVESRERFRGESSFRTYLLAIARRLLLKRYRKQLRGERALALNGITAAQVSGSPSFVVAAREELRVLLTVLRRIPIDHQIALELYYWEELPIAEIARILEVAPGTVKSRLGRARTLLREQFTEVSASALLRTSVEDATLWAAEIRSLHLGNGSGAREPTG